MSKNKKLTDKSIVYVETLGDDLIFENGYSLRPTFSSQPIELGELKALAAAMGWYIEEGFGCYIDD